MFIYNTNSGFNGGKWTKVKKKRIQKGTGHKIGRRSVGGRKNKKRKQLTKSNQSFLRSLGLKLKKK